MRKKKARNWFPCRVCRREHQNPASSTLCSLECHKQEVGITMREPLKIEIGDTVKIVETSSYYPELKEDNPKCEGVVSRVAGSIEVEWNNGCSNVYQSYDLTLIKKDNAIY
jgi:hypothetical protein